MKMKAGSSFRNDYSDNERFTRRTPNETPEIKDEEEEEEEKESPDERAATRAVSKSRSKKRRKTTADGPLKLIKDDPYPPEVQDMFSVRKTRRTKYSLAEN